MATDTDRRIAQVVAAEIGARPDQVAAAAGDRAARAVVADPHALDDGTGPVDLTFFEDAQGGFATTVFNSWLLVGLGELRRTGAYLADHAPGVPVQLTGFRPHGVRSTARAIPEPTTSQRAAYAALVAESFPAELLTVV